MIDYNEGTTLPVVLQLREGTAGHYYGTTIVISPSEKVAQGVKDKRPYYRRFEKKNGGH
jgi:hypothetical protein